MECPKCKVVLSSDGAFYYCSICGYEKQIKEKLKRMEKE